MVHVLLSCDDVGTVFFYCERLAKENGQVLFFCDKISSAFYCYAEAYK